MILKPENIAIAGVFSYFIVIVCAPVDVLVPFELNSFTYVFLSYVFFLIGCYSIKIRGFRIRLRLYDKVSYNLIFFMGFVGVLIRYYDRFFHRGLNLSLSIFQSRELLLDNAFTFLSVISAFLYPFAFIPLMVLMIKKAKGFSIKSVYFYCAILLFFSPFLDFFLVGSRSQIFLLFGLLYFAVGVIYKKGRFYLPFSLISVFLLFVLLFLTVYLFMARMDEQGMFLYDSVIHSAYAYTVVLEEDLWQSTNELPDYLSSIFFSFFSFVQYYLHGFFEFSLLFNSPREQIFSFGTHIFGVYVKLLSPLFPFLSVVPGYELYTRSGIFTSFFGPVWVDFGWVGLLFMYFIGLFSKYIYKGVLWGKENFVPLYCYISVVIFFMPVINFIVSAQGIYIFSSFLFFSLFDDTQFFS